MATLRVLNERRVTQRNYFQRFRETARKLYESSPFAGDPHIINGQNNELRKAAIMLMNRYTGSISNVDPNPKLGRYTSSALIQRITTKGGEYFQLSETGPRVPFPEKQVKETLERVLAGGVIWEHMVGGKATRMKITQEKFLLSPRELLSKFQKDDPERAQRLTRLPEDFSLGVRHMLAFSYSIRKLAEEKGLNWRNVLRNQTVFIIANEKIMDEILSLFKVFGYFGLDPDKVLFMASKTYNALPLDENGNFHEKPIEDFIHNHGVARLETTEDNVWFSYYNGTKKYFTHDQIKETYAQHANLQSLNIEDLDYLLQAIDPFALTLALRGREIIQADEEFNMTMDVVGQKEPPQKGGVLAYDPNFFEQGSGRIVMIESFQSYPRFFHYLDAVARKLWRNISWLNLNMNNYPHPNKLFEMIEQQGLPVWLEIKEIGNGLFGIRNESPQGDANYFLPTLYIARLVSVINENTGVREDVPVIIRNLKEPTDIPIGLKYMAAQDQLPGFLSFAKNFKEGGR